MIHDIESSFSSASISGELYVLGQLIQSCMSFTATTSFTKASQKGNLPFKMNYERRRIEVIINKKRGGICVTTKKVNQLVNGGVFP